MIWSVSGNSMSLWDLSLGKKIFVHAGHLDQINQIDLHPFEPMTVASVDNSNDIHVFQPTPNIKN
jgi:WD40 repeat protein